ncbi:MAG: ABC transporter permease subunit [Clostridia bacterium]|nr:ABC transporter permease subunit [Deltaproteobacteria bacterium]
MLDPAVMLDAVPRLLGGVSLTLQLTACVLIAGATLAVPIALAHESSHSALRRGARAYMLLFRGTPTLVQIFIVYYGLGQFEMVRLSPAWPVLREPFWCAVIALGLNSAAYTGRLLAGALQSVPRGLIGAAQALGLSPGQVFRSIQLPLALRLAVPAYGNEVILTLKATSLASTITLMELMGTARVLVSDTFAPYEIFVTAGAVYLALTFAIARVFRQIERRMRLGT